MSDGDDDDRVGLAAEEDDVRESLHDLHPIRPRGPPKRMSEGRGHDGLACAVDHGDELDAEPSAP